MKTNLDSPAVLAIDDARRELCQRLADAMHAGVFRFQIRFPRHGDEFDEVWVYVHQEREWLKRDGFTLPANLAPSLWNQMEMISTRDYADVWNCRRVDHSDRTDFDLTFHRKKVESHLASDLESFLKGCLFLGHHDSGKDARRRIRFRGR